jgi:citrate synthase
MLEAMRRVRPLRGALVARLRRGESVDRFGHPCTLTGPRARECCWIFSASYTKSAERRFIETFAPAATAATGDHPNADFGLAAVVRVLHLPGGPPLMLFAIGRSVGWIGHAIEQYATGQLIRPRAKYGSSATDPIIPSATRRSARSPWRAARAGRSRAARSRPRRPPRVRAPAG